MDAFNIQGNNGGAATGAVGSAAVALNGAAASKQQLMRIVTDNYIRVAFGDSSVVADGTSPLYAPGMDITERENGTTVYYSLYVPSGTANWSINPGPAAPVRAAATLTKTNY